MLSLPVLTEIAMGGKVQTSNLDGGPGGRGGLGGVDELVDARPGGLGGSGTTWRTCSGGDIRDRLRLMAPLKECLV